MSINFISRVKRLLISISIIVGHLNRVHRKFWDNVIEYVFHLTIFHRRIGDVYFDVELAVADGFIRHVVRGDDGCHRIFEMPFRISNRWMARNKRHCPVEVVWGVKTAASTQINLKVHSLVWGVETFRRSEVKPFDLTNLPDESVIKHRHNLMRKVEEFRSKFTNPSNETTYSQRSAADIIIR